MFTPEHLRELSLQAAERYSQRISERGKADVRTPSTSEVYLAKTQAKDRTRALAAEASDTSASQLDAIRALSEERVIGTPDFQDINYLEFAIAVSRGIARIHLPDGFGTGSLVGPRLLLTNHHVIETEDAARGAVAEFDYQDDVNGNRLQLQPFACDPDTFFHTDPDLDFTIVAVAPTSQIGTPITNYPWTRLIGTPGKTANGMAINIIQHPMGGLKQIVFRNNKIIEIPDGKPDFLYYTADTKPGSSGSPCFTDAWEMVALHHLAVPRIENGKIVEWIANEGVRVSAMVAALRSDVNDPQMRDLLQEMLDSTPPNPIEKARRSTQPGGADRQSVKLDGSVATWNIPLVVQIKLDAPTLYNEPPQAAIAQQPRQAEVLASNLEPKAIVQAEEALKVDPYSIKRDGYDLSFLEWEAPIPLPQLSDEQQADTVEVPSDYQGDHGPLVLDYHYYSVAICKSRKFAWYSAANIDGDHRPKLPKRSSDKWHIDPRIEPDPSRPVNQVGEELYREDQTDRGHLTRYLDLAWGNTAQAALAAMADTFHFTNCTLQLSGFNQGKDRWQGLEQFLLEQHARKEARKMNVMTGPILRDKDPMYKNRFMNIGVRLPIAFWKVCVLVREDGTLSATAFIMDQNDVTDLPGFEERFDVIAVQCTLADLERETGLDFGMLNEHDHMAEGGAPGTLEVMRNGVSTLRKPILDVRDIVLPPLRSSLRV